MSAKSFDSEERRIFDPIIIIHFQKSTHVPYAYLWRIENRTAE